MVVAQKNYSSLERDRVRDGVVYAKYQDSYENWVIIDQQEGISGRFWHNSIHIAQKVMDNLYKEEQCEFKRIFVVNDGYEYTFECEKHAVPRFITRELLPFPKPLNEYLKEIETQGKHHPAYFPLLAALESMKELGQSYTMDLLTESLKNGKNQKSHSST